MKSALAKKNKENTSNLENQFLFQQSMYEPDTFKNITIKDLCPEEKEKVGQLIQKLADEIQKNKLLEKNNSKIVKKYEKMIIDLKNDVQAILSQQKQMENKIKQQIQLIKEQQSTIEQLNKQIAQQQQPQQENVIFERKSTFGNNVRTEQNLQKEYVSIKINEGDAEKKLQQLSNKKLDEGVNVGTQALNEIQKLKTELFSITKDFKTINPGKNIGQDKEIQLKSIQTQSYYKNDIDNDSQEDEEEIKIINVNKNLKIKKAKTQISKPYIANNSSIQQIKQSLIKNNSNSSLEQDINNQSINKFDNKKSQKFEDSKLKTASQNYSLSFNISHENTPNQIAKNSVQKQNTNYHQNLINETNEDFQILQPPLPQPKISTQHFSESAKKLQKVYSKKLLDLVDSIEQDQSFHIQELNQKYARQK